MYITTDFLNNLNTYLDNFTIQIMYNQCLIIFYSILFDNFLYTENKYICV